MTTQRRTFLRSLLATAVGSALGLESFAAEELPIVSIPQNGWHHIAVVRQTDAPKLYLDGVQVQDIDNLTVTQTADKIQITSPHIGKQLSSDWAHHTIELPKDNAVLDYNKDFTIEFWAKAPDCKLV
jgi:hypothetical protein